MSKIKSIIDKLNKQIAKSLKVEESNSIQLASELKYEYKYIQTPWTTLNKLIVGFPRGRFATLAGASQTGKTALMLQTIAYNQGINPDFITIWTDFENQFDANWAESLGVDLERLILQRYDTDTPFMEPHLDRALTLIQSKAVSMWVIDSLGAMTPKADIIDKSGNRSLEDNNMLRLQIKLGEFYRKANVFIAPSQDFDGCSVVLIGHVYNVPTTSGAKIEEVKGGNSVKHWANIRLMTRRGSKDEGPSEITCKSVDGKNIKIRPGWSGRIKLDKTRQNAREGQEVLLTFYHGRGFDWKESTISAAIGLEIIKINGPMYVSDILPNGKIKGKEELIKYLTNDNEAYKKLEALVDQVSVENILVSETAKESINEEEL